MVNREFVLDYIQSLQNVSYDCPFDEDFDSTVMRHEESGKWFGLIMSVSGNKIGRQRLDHLDIINLKSNPEDSVILFELYPTIIPAYHMNKTHWITVPLDNSINENLICSLIDKSYYLTKSRGKK